MRQNNVKEERNIYRRWGCECSAGWYEIIRDCCQQIDEIYVQHGIMEIDFEPAQIKEKWGTLVFRYGYKDAPCGATIDFIGSGVSIRFDSDREVTDTDSAEVRDRKRLREEIAQIVKKAEERSKMTCEWCGDNKTASLRKNLGGRIITLCDSCAGRYIEKQNQRRRELKE